MRIAVREMRKRAEEVRRCVFARLPRRAHEMRNEAFEMRERAALFDLMTVRAHMAHFGIAGVPHRARFGVQPNQTSTAIAHFFEYV